MYKQFPQDSDSEREDTPTQVTANGDVMNDPEISNLRPLTRSSIKPRLLFPSSREENRRSTVALAEEEGSTDVEDRSKRHHDSIVTPVKKSFEPATPPTTGHATRSTTQKQRDDVVSSPGQDMPEAGNGVHTRKQKVSPFDGWARTKVGMGVIKSKKRDAETMEKGGGDDAKRLRSSATSEY